MREPVVAQKVGNRSGIGKGRSAVGQRPAKRGSNETIGSASQIVAGLRAARVADRRDRHHRLDRVCRLSCGCVCELLSGANDRDAWRVASFG